MPRINEVRGKKRDRFFVRNLLLDGGVCALVLSVALFPAIMIFLRPESKAITPGAMVLYNLLAWLMVFLFYRSRRSFYYRLRKVSNDIGIDTRLKSIESLVQLLLIEVQRKNDSISASIFEKRLTSKEELSDALERIVAKAYRLLDADSAELALFDEESGMYHSSFVLGIPFRTSAQAMLIDASGSDEKDREISPDVLVQPIAFAGTVLGTLRVGLRGGRLPSVPDREVMNLLALQAGFALINAKYSQELLKMKQKSDESVRAKTGFLANLSHEIRGPLGIILNAVELVLDGLCGPLNDDQSETLKMVHSNGQHLLELINDVLDYAKIESGKIVPNKAEILLSEILTDICAVVRTQADAKNHKVIQRPTAEALAISCDRRHLRQMLINLLTNAIKYTPDGGTIEVWAERAPGNKIKINVKDTGVGIKPVDRDKVFAAFERIENSYSIAQIGTGLGMPLTKRLVEVNGGSINFDSVSGQGSTFWMVFPATDAGAVSRVTEENQEATVRGNGELVLIVARDDGERNMLSRYLQHIGFKVAKAASKIEAIEYLRNKDVGVVVLDNNITDKPDENLVALVRQNAKSSSIPLILVSSRAFVFDIERYLKAGVDRYLSKPVELKELAYVCRHLIDGTYKGVVVDEAELAATDKKSEKKKDHPTRVYRGGDIYH